MSPGQFKQRKIKVPNIQHLKEISFKFVELKIPVMNCVHQFKIYFN